jgi:hypothetical protein
MHVSCLPRVAREPNHVKAVHERRAAITTLDWSQCPAVESVPGKVSGAWVFRGTRLHVATIIENLEDLSVEEVMD